MIELLTSITPMQWLWIGGGVLFLVPPAINLIKKSTKPLKRSAPSVELSLKSNNLTSIVHKWESLDNACEAAGLVEAQEKLREVFLAFAKKPSKPKIDEKVSVL